MADRPLKILVVTSIYPTPEEPGLGAFVASQVASLRSAGLRADVLFLDVRRPKWELVRGAFQVRRQARHYDLIHAHFGYNGIPACLQSRTPVVVSFCGTDLVHPKLSGISRWVAHRADACIVKSDRLLRRLDVPAAVIPNGVDTDRFRPAPKSDARRRLGLNPHGYYALFAADPARPEKRYGLAEAALAEVGRAGIAVEPLVMHNRPHSEVPHYLNAADLLLLTSSHEGSPNAVKEAMACNLPVVSTDVGDVRQIVGKARNCRVCADTPGALAQGVRAVLETGGRSNGRPCIAHLSAEAVAARVIGVYRAVLERRGRA